MQYFRQASVNIVRLDSLRTAMNIYIYLIAGVFIISAACGFIFIPIILNFCKAKNLYDIPNPRKIHKNAVPRLGGTAFMPSMFIAFAVAVMAFYPSGRHITISLWSLLFLTSILLVYVIGLLDDVFGLSPAVKLIVQIISACMLPLSGLYINNLYGFMGINGVPYTAGVLLSVFVTVFIDNAINLIDGIDGLAAGLSIIALGGFLYIFSLQGVWIYSALIAGLIGVLVAFMYFNIFGSADKNRKIFMGDAGSLSLGFILGFLCVKYTMDNPAAISCRYFDFIMAFTLLAVPMFDVVRVSLVRIYHCKSPFKADKRHIHHKCMRAGLSQHQTLGCIVCLQLVFIAANALLLNVMSNTLVVAVDIVFYIFINLILNFFIRKRERLARSF